MAEQEALTLLPGSAAWGIAKEPQQLAFDFHGNIDPNGGAGDQVPVVLSPSQL